jgi:hypothetical protein
MTQPEQPKRRKRFSSPAPFIVLAVVSIILVAAWWFAGRNQNFGVTAGTRAQFAPDSVTYNAAHHFFIVQLPAVGNDPNGGLRAFSDLETVSHCRVEWQQSNGVFAESCLGSTYARDGTRISGAGAPTLRPLPLRLSGDAVIVLPAE